MVGDYSLEQWPDLDSMGEYPPLGIPEPFQLGVEEMPEDYDDVELGAVPEYIQ